LGSSAYLIDSRLTAASTSSYVAFSARPNARYGLGPDDAGADDCFFFPNPKSMVTRTGEREAGREPKPAGCAVTAAVADERECVTSAVACAKAANVIARIPSGLMALDEQCGVVAPPAGASPARRANSLRLEVNGVFINLGLDSHTAELGFLSYDNTSTM
jgi:hypothetical protein